MLDARVPEGGDQYTVSDHTNSVYVRRFQPFWLMSTAEMEHRTKYCRNKYRSCRRASRIELTENHVLCETDRLGSSRQVRAGVIRKYRFKDNKNSPFSGEKLPQSRFI